VPAPAPRAEDAAGVLAPIGVVLPPAAAAVLMSVSTIVVALNAQLFRRLHLDPAHLARTRQATRHIRANRAALVSTDA
jgi:Cu2+-exporting ATPase